jgi:phosphate-selective porin OprO/OprP
MSLRAPLFAVLLLASSNAFATPGEPPPTDNPTPNPASRSALPSGPDLSPSPVPDAKAKKPWRGFRFASDDEANTLRIGGQLQADSLSFPGDEAQILNDEVRLRRARLQLRATTARFYDFRLLLDFADARVQILDALFESTFIDELHLRIGKDKSPVSFDRLQSSTALHFLERTATAGLVTNRDLGLQLAGKISKGLLDYQLGLWDGTPDGASAEQNVGDTFDFAGRLTFQPFLHAELPALKNLQVGVSGSYGKDKGTATATQLASYRSSARATWFRYVTGADLASTAIADGERVRLGAHLYWQYGPVHVFGEVIKSSQEVTLAGRTEAIGVLGYTSQASVVLTGEDASWNGLTPDRVFNPETGGWGALELAVRWGQIAIDDLAFDAGFADISRSARGLSTITFGLNWYLDRQVKLQANLELTSFDGGAPADADRDTETLLGFRGQFLF